MIYYIPGCDVVRNHPEAGKRALEYMKAKGITEGPCCRKDLSVLKDGDTLIINCTQCSLIFAERVPEVKIISLYEYLLNETDYVWKDFHGENMTLQDCWRMRSNPVIHEAIRKCLANMNVNITELPKNREKADFCGVWLNNPAASDCVEVAPVTFAEMEKHRVLLSAEEQKQKMTEYVTKYKTDRTVVYCNGCEKGIRLGGGNPVHMIELLFGN